MQLALAYDAAHVGADVWQLKLAWLRRAVDVLGHKEVAFKLDIAPSQLTDALLERERKDVKAKWFDVVLAMGLPSEMRTEYVRITCDALDYETPKLKQKKTDKQQLSELQDFLEHNAPALMAMFERTKR
jgi:hypothetical protein